MQFCPTFFAIGLNNQDISGLSLIGTAIAKPDTCSLNHIAATMCHFKRL